MSRHHNCNHHNDSSGMGCLVVIILGILAMPLAGLYMLLAGKDSEQKAVGLILTIVGFIFWIMVAANS